ncbi:MAG: DUF177 domain-containing protein [Cyanobacteria bacterium RUI128]|nr:DUF177 domain-containing protein [Cyanobacteria bacterium RUI128]
MYNISIQDIEDNKDKTLHFSFDDEISELKAKVSAELDLTSLGEFIEVKGQVSGSVKLECDMCLEEFDYKLDFPIKETYAKNSLYEEYGQETEIKEGQFITDLNGANEIDVYDLLYQSVILQLPNKKVCGINCKGGNFAKDDSGFIQDERMAVFKSIKIDKK